MMTEYPYLISIRLDESLYRTLRRNARLNERSIPQEVRFILRKYYGLQREEKHEMKSEGGR